MGSPSQDLGPLLVSISLLGIITAVFAILVNVSARKWLSPAAAF